MIPYKFGNYLVVRVVVMNGYLNGMITERRKLKIILSERGFGVKGKSLHKSNVSFAYHAYTSIAMLPGLR